jgi:proton-translocating NADH-quinone oxidoreductase chain M
MFILDHLLLIIISLPLIGASFIGFCINNTDKSKLNFFSLFFSFITFIVSLFLWILFDNSTGKFQFIEIFQWLPNYNINCFLGVDGLSLFFILLVTFLTPFCLLSSLEVIKSNFKEFIILFLIMESFLLIVFSVLDVILFYIFFESILIPMFLIIGIWGSRKRKIRSNYMFFLYTLFGSILMLIAILFIFFKTGTTDYQYLLLNPFSAYYQKILWLAFFIGFAVKVPMFPFHIWLPEAHVEAPTSGSVMLAGILLKLGTYGFIRFLIPLFPIATVYYTPFVYIIGLIGIVYTSLTAIRQTDLKKIIAYASVAHMNLVIIGLFTFNIYGIEGSILQMLNHGIISSALFLGIGVLYDRYHTKLLKYYSGLSFVMPIFSIIFLIFTLANIAVPGTNSFVSELLILTGLFQNNMFITFFSATSMVLGAVYSLWLYNRIFFGVIKIKNINTFSDLNYREFIMFVPLLLLTFIIGIYPELILKPMNVTILNLIEHIK